MSDTINERLERMERTQQAILAKVEGLAGNGQPGRVGILEKRMLRVESDVSFMRGKLVAYGSLGVLFLAGVEVAMKFIH